MSRDVDELIQNILNNGRIRGEVAKQVLINRIDRPPTDEEYAVARLSLNRDGKAVWPVIKPEPSAIERKKKVFLTGASGSIGAHFVAHFLEETNWDIVAVGSFRHKGDMDRLTEVVTDEYKPRVTLLVHDLVAPLTQRQIDKVGKVDIIINLASLSDVQASIDDPVPFLRNNHELMINVLEYARVAKPEVFLQFSTDEVYGPAGLEWQDCREEGCTKTGLVKGKFEKNPSPVGHKHAYAKGHPEWDTILPSNPYAASKAAQEAYAIAYWRSYGVPVVITNTMNNFGEMQQASKYPVIIQKKVDAGEKVTVHAASDGQIGTRYYLHSANAADAVRFILGIPPHLHEAGQVDRPDRYNIVGSKQVSNLELAEEIANIMGKDLEYELVDFHSEQPGHDLHYGLDGTKLYEAGWTESVSFEDSLRQTVAWQQKNKEWIQ